jgi:hypothetical protein
VRLPKLYERDNEVSRTADPISERERGNEMNKIEYEIQFIKDELQDNNFPELNRDELNTWLTALEWVLPEYCKKVSV